MKRKQLLILLLLFIYYNALAFTGLTDWSYKTKGGIVIDNYSGSDLNININRDGYADGIVRDIFRFYFYKNWIIGKTNTYFFIINDNNKDYFEFYTEEEWENYISINKLKPKNGIMGKLH